MGGGEREEGRIVIDSTDPHFWREKTRRGKVEEGCTEAWEEGGSIRGGRNIAREGGALGSRLLTWCRGLRLRVKILTEDLPLGPSALGNFLVDDPI